MSNLTATAAGPSTSSPSDGSRTQTIQDSQPRVEDDSSNPSHDQGDTPHGVLRLRGGPRSRPAVVWREDVIDNEDMGKKSSKSASHSFPSRAPLTNVDLLPVAEPVCCIYHKARKFGESSSEESSSDSDSDSECDHAHRRHRNHQPANGNGGAEKERNREGAQVEELESDDEPNAYERPPGWKRNKGERKASGSSEPQVSVPGVFSDPAQLNQTSITSHRSPRIITTSRYFHERCEKEV
jgi:protein phosphatase 1 regulatory subunit 11